MVLRVASVVGVLLVGLAVGLMIDLGAPGQALAQYYPPPPQPYPPQSYPPQAYPNRQLPPPVQAEPDDDLDALGPPRTFGYPASRPPQPGVQYGGRGAYPQDSDPYAPASAYPNSAPPPAYGGPAPLGPDDAIRPPMSIGPDQGGAQAGQGGPGSQGGIATLPPDYQPETGP